MTPEARQMLDQFDEFFLKYTGTLPAAEVWDVLCALRGPDASFSDTLKAQTTVHVRAAAFPKLARQRGKSFEASIANIVRDKPFKLPTEEDHFAWHVRAAVAILGISEEG